MQIKAEQKFIRLSPRKVRLVANSLKGLSVTQAQDQLTISSLRAAKPILKTLKQAIANAVNNRSLNYKALTLANIQVGQGPTYKRWRPVSRGRSHPILKRSSHIKVILQSLEPQPKPKTKIATKTKTTKTKK